MFSKASSDGAMIFTRVSVGGSMLGEEETYGHSVIARELKKNVRVFLQKLALERSGGVTGECTDFDQIIES